MDFPLTATDAVPNSILWYFVLAGVKIQSRQNDADGLKRYNGVSNSQSNYMYNIRDV